MIYFNRNQDKDEQIKKARNGHKTLSSQLHILFVYFFHKFTNSLLAKYYQMHNANLKPFFFSRDCWMRQIKNKKSTTFK